MIFIISKKFLTEHPKRYLKAKDYTIIDGASDEEASGRKSLSAKFNRVVPIGDFYPGNRLVRGLLEKEKGTEANKISPRKLKEMKMDFLDDNDLIQAMLAVVKIQLCVAEHDGTNVPLDKNVFIVLPQKLYKTLGKDIYKTMRDLFSNNGDSFIFFQSHLQEDPSLVEMKFKHKLAKAVSKELEKIEKKRKFV